MRLICPGCSAEYEIDDDLIPPEGREVQCSNCDHGWFQRPPPLDSPLSDELGTDAGLRTAAPEGHGVDTPEALVPSEEDAAPRPPLPRPAVVTVQRVQVADDGAPEAAQAPSSAAGPSAPALSAPAPSAPTSPDPGLPEPDLPEPDLIEPDLTGPSMSAADTSAPPPVSGPPAPDPPASPVGSDAPAAQASPTGGAAARLDPGVHEILVSEARREISARRAASPLETQEELGLESASPVVHRPDRHATPPAGETGPASAGSHNAGDVAATAAGAAAASEGSPAVGAQAGEGMNVSAAPDAAARGADAAALPDPVSSAPSAAGVGEADEAARRDSSTATGAGAAPSPAGSVASPPPAGAEAGALPSDSARTEGAAQEDAPVAVPAGATRAPSSGRAGGGFAVGFVSVLVLAVALALLDRFAGPLAEAWPPAAPALDLLAQQVALLRQWLESAAGVVAGWLR